MDEVDVNKELEECRQEAEHSGRTYILYDSRACAGDTSEASVLVACESEEEAKSYRGDYGGMACYSYATALPSKPGGYPELVDERFEWNWYPGEKRKRKKRRPR